uniref:Uncharacterized protein n=1 Tax=Nothobranchius pienaari TaxID=704102 RepID=A0A1A8L971_9TELE
MKPGMNLVFSVLMAISIALGHDGISKPPDLTEDPRHELLQLNTNPSGRDRTSAGPTTSSSTEESVQPETPTKAGPKIPFYVSTATAETFQHWRASTLTSPGSVSSTSSSTFVHEGRTRESTPTVSPPTVQASSATDHTSTSHPPSESGTTVSTQNIGPTQTSAGLGPAGPSHQEFPSELNVGDEGLKGPHHRSRTPLDPLLAGLLSVFIVTTAIVFVVLFFKFRQRMNHPEFHRLQDLPMVQPLTEAHILFDSSNTQRTCVY